MSFPLQRWGIFRPAADRPAGGRYHVIVVFGVWRDVESVRLPQDSSFRRIFHVWLRRGEGSAESHVYQDEPHPDGCMVDSLSGHPDLDIFDHEHRRGRVCRND